jgi:gas vesicle protein
MAQDTDQMRARIEQQRTDITHTVDQIGNRVNPSHIVARRQDRMRRRLTGWKDAVFGNDEPDFMPPRGDQPRFPEQPDSDGGMRDRFGEATSNATSTVQHAPSAVRRQTRGNPMAAGAIAVGAGWLIGSLLPESRSEQRAVHRIEPQLAEAAAEAKHEAQGLAQDLKEPAKDAATHVKDAGSSAVGDVKERASQSAGKVSEQARRS